MKFKNRIQRNLAIVLVAALLCISLNTQEKALAALAITKVTVSTQKELDKALSNDTIVSITIKTSKKVTLNIPNKKYSGKRLYVKAPNAIITNKGKFKSVNVFVTTPKELDKALKNTSLKATYITISTTKAVEFNIPKKDYSKLGLIIIAPKAIINNNANFKTLNIYVGTQDQLNQALKLPDVTTVSIVTKDAVEIIIGEGDYSNIKLVVNAPKALITNLAIFKETIISAGSKVKIQAEEVTPTPTTEPINENTNGGYSGGGSAGGGTITPTTPVPTTPVTPTPTEPTPEPPTPTPGEPNPSEPEEALKTLKIQYTANIRTEADKLFPYMSFAAWNDFNNGVVNEWISRISSYTNAQDLENNYEGILTAVKSYQQTIERYINNIPIFMNVITPEELINNYSDSLTADGEYYEFTTLKSSFGIEKYYYVAADNSSYVNNITFENAYAHNVVSGSAITYDIKAWNNINGAADIVGVYVLSDSENEGQYTIGDALEEGVHYQILDNALVIKESVTSGLLPGHYGLFVKTQVPYLDIESSGNYIYFDIVD